jgi:hypothetical protein
MPCQTAERAGRSGIDDTAVRYASGMNGSLTPWKILSTVLAVGLLAAPLLALTIGPEVGLAVLVAAVGAVLWLALQARNQVAPELRPRLQTMIIANTIVLALAVIGLAIYLIE